MARGRGGGGWGISGGVASHGPKYDHPYDPPRAMAKLI